MKTLLQRLWLEPAAAIAALVIVLTIAQAAVPVSGTMHALIAAVLVAFGGQQTRARVTPNTKETP